MLYLLQNLKNKIKIMSYVITERRSDITVTTTVEYTFGETVVVVDIPHFNPADEAAIILGIENRAITEQAKLVQ